MLKKLFVHEWKDTWKLLTLLNILVMVLTVIGMITIQNDVWNKVDDSPIYSVTLMGYIMFYILAIGALSMCVSVYFWFRFYKNLYTDQGYLMHTLPVTSHELILSKGLVALIWQFISMIVMMVSIFSIIFSIAASEGETVATIFAAMFEELEMTGSAAYMLIACILTSVSGCVMSIMMGYTSVSIGQLFKKHRLGAAVGVYVGLYMAVQSVSSYGTIPIAMTIEKIETEENMLMMMGHLFMVMFVVVATISVGMYFVTNYIMKNKLNLE